MGMAVLDENGDKRVPIMGSYGIGVGRALAAIIETHHDDNGVIWPVAVAPFEVSVILVSMRDEATVAAAEDVYDQLRMRGIDVVLDDRDSRAGVKFADTELVGIPWRITLGPKGVEKGMVELTSRATGETVEVALADIVEHAGSIIEAERIPEGAEPIFR